MKALVVVGIVLMVLGAAGLIIGFVSYEDTDPVVDIGPIEVTKTTEKRKRIPTALSATVLGVGAVVTVVGAMKGK